MEYNCAERHQLIERLPNSKVKQCSASDGEIIRTFF